MYKIFFGSCQKPTRHTGEVMYYIPLRKSTVNRYCSEIEVQQDCLKFCKIVNNLANLEPKVNKAVVGVQSFDDIIVVGSVAIGQRPNTY